MNRLFQVVNTNELGPAEAVPAVGMACLPLSGEQKHRFPVFMLEALDESFFIGRDILLQLISRMRVESPA
jgi:hypothetical protein